MSFEVNARASVSAGEYIAGSRGLGALRRELLLDLAALPGAQVELGVGRHRGYGYFGPYADMVFPGAGRVFDLSRPNLEAREMFLASADRVYRPTIEEGGSVVTWRRSRKRRASAPIGLLGQYFQAAAGDPCSRLRSVLKEIDGGWASIDLLEEGGFTTWQNDAGGEIARLTLLGLWALEMGRASLPPRVEARLAAQWFFVK